jgi:hypothetical protein
MLAVDPGPVSAVRVRVLNRGAEFASYVGDLQGSDELADEALQTARALGYCPGEAHALARLGMTAQLRGLHDLSVTLFREGVRIAVQSGDAKTVFYARQKFFEAARISGELEMAAGLMEDNLALARRRGED